MTRFDRRLLGAIGALVRAIDHIGARCPVCDRRLERGQLTDDVMVAYLGEAVRVHRYCSREARRQMGEVRPAKVGQVIHV